MSEKDLAQPLNNHHSGAPGNLACGKVTYSLAPSALCIVYRPASRFLQFFERCSGLSFPVYFLCSHFQAGLSPLQPHTMFKQVFLKLTSSSHASTEPTPPTTPACPALVICPYAPSAIWTWFLAFPGRYSVSASSTLSSTSDTSFTYSGQCFFWTEN